jgi:hypothetical protein
MTDPILVHDNSDAINAERAAMHTGRAEAWLWGKIDREKLWEYDWSNSYPRIAKDNELPSQLFGTVTSCTPRRLLELQRQYCVLADVSVSASSPCVPVSHGERTIWPTGNFRTILWNPELDVIRQDGEITEVHKVWLYKRAPVLRGWAEWILSQLGNLAGNVPPWLKLILKHWSRALIGRFGMRYKAWQHYATAPTSRIYCSELYDPESGQKSEIMQVGTDVFMLGELTEPSDACPQITSYVMSAARAKLWRVISQIGRDNCAYMDTDSIVVNINGHHAIQQAHSERDFAGLRSKGEYRRSHIYGPRSAVFAGKPVVAGMPKRPIKVAAHSYEGEIWRSAGEGIKRGEHDTVNVVSRSYTLRYNTNRRAFLDGGGTAPYKLPDMRTDYDCRTTPRYPNRMVLSDYPALRPLIKTARSRPRPVARL